MRIFLAVAIALPEWTPHIYVDDLARADLRRLAYAMLAFFASLAVMAIVSTLRRRRELPIG